MYSPQNYFRRVEEQSGRTAATAFCTVCLWYFLTHTAVCARLWAEWFRAYLAPGALVSVLSVLPVLAGLLYLGKGQRFYNRAGKYPEIVLSVLCAGYIWFSEISTGQREIAASALLLVSFFSAVAGGIRYVRLSFDYLYEVSTEFYRSQMVYGIRDQIREIREKLTGALYAGKFSRYGEKLSAKLSAARIWWWITVLAIYALTAGFDDAFIAASFYRAYNLQILVPATALLGTAAAIAGCVRTRRLYRENN